MVVDSSLAKSMAIKMELEGFAKVGLTIESDSMMTCSDMLARSWIAVPVYAQVDSLASEIGDVIFSFVFRESTGLANALAKSGAFRLCLFSVFYKSLQVL